MAKLWIVLSLVITPLMSVYDKVTHDDISCHYITEGDTLPSTEDISFSPPPDSIFFHETSCQGVMNSRQACAIESAAKAHPGKNVYVLFSGPTGDTRFSNRNSLFELSLFYPNINFARVHIDEYAKDTPLQNILKNITNYPSQRRVFYTSEYLRFITLHKFGGLYLDTDVIVIKPLYSLGKNWVARESNLFVNNAVICQPGLVMWTMVCWYEVMVWRYNHPLVCIRIHPLLSSTSLILTESLIPGFQVHDSELIYPVSYRHFFKLLEPGDLPKVNHAYTVHLWNGYSHGEKVQRSSPFDRMAEQYCPVIRELYRDCFGT
ncbi:Uncharacterized protein OBRU01_17814 [Operophtera brumata]|uniref:Alpha 1,4-glycosyltransferase domain-containing protein n=1 Tax=Operophtera brumata TaxID=104452 RepID=A0A0L7KVN6_OPEBR|nr:Uncharacterized protein OBRU01_17814 [Operophtera brumata]